MLLPPKRYPKTSDLKKLKYVRHIIKKMEHELAFEYIRRDKEGKLSESYKKSYFNLNKKLLVADFIVLDQMLLDIAAEKMLQNIENVKK